MQVLSEKEQDKNKIIRLNYFEEISMIIVFIVIIIQFFCIKRHFMSKFFSACPTGGSKQAISTGI